MAQLVTKRYAKAMFELALERNLVDEFLDCSNLLISLYKNDEDFKQFILNPLVNKEEKLAFIEKVLKGKVPDDFIGFFAVVFNKNREDEFAEIVSDLIFMLHEHKNIVYAEVFSAVELSTEQISGIKAKLSEKTNKQVEIHTSVRPELIGGLCIRIDGKIIDASVKYHLQSVKKQLLNFQPIQ